MTKKGSIKETGEEIADDKWQRFEAAVGVDKDRSDSASRDDAVRTDQPYREEVQQPDHAGNQTRPDDAGDPDRMREAGKTTTRTE